MFVFYFAELGSLRVARSMKVFYPVFLGLSLALLSALKLFNLLLQFDIVSTTILCRLGGL